MDLDQVIAAGKTFREDREAEFPKTAYKVKVMKAFMEGKEVLFKRRNKTNIQAIDNLEPFYANSFGEPEWNWEKYNYWIENES